MILRNFFIFIKILFLVLSLSGCFTWSSVERKQAENRILMASAPMQRSYRFAKKIGSVSKAIRQLESTLKGDKKRISQHLVLARLYLLKGLTKKAIYRVNFVERFDYRNKEAKLIRANAEFANGKLEKSSLILESIVSEFKLNREDQEEVLNLSAGISQRRGDLEETVVKLNKALRVSPRYLATRMNLALIYLQHQEYSDAAVHLEYIKRQIKGDFYIDVNLGAAYSGLGHYKKAEALFDGIDALDSQEHYLYYNRALLEFRQKNYSECFDLLKDYLDSAPKPFVAKRKVRAILDDIQIVRLVRSGVPAGIVEDMLENIGDLDDDNISRTKVDLHSADVEFSSQHVFTSIGYFAD